MTCKKTISDVSQIQQFFVPIIDANIGVQDEEQHQEERDAHIDIDILPTY